MYIPTIKMVVLDFETRSFCPISNGADVYATDPTTGILCLCLHDMVTDSTYLWTPTDPVPPEITKLLKDAEVVAAHNARFDQLIYECVAVEYGFPPLNPDVWYCTSAQARANALPASLEDAMRALNAKNKKDHRGKQLIKKLSIPHDGMFVECPDTFVEMCAYCAKDVLATVELIRSTRLLTDDEWEDWRVNERINDRGVKIDVPLAIAATQYATVERDAIANELTALTGGVVTKHSQHQRIKKYVLDRAPHLETFATIYKAGEKKLSMDKNVRGTILLATDSGDLEIPDNVYDVLMCADEGNKSSVAKFTKMLSMASPDDGRVRGAFIFAGAGQTLRFSSKGLQLHNMARDCFSPAETEALRVNMLNGIDIPDVMVTLSKLLRPTLIPDEGKVFVVGDWSAIEGRVLPWLAGDEKTLDIFRRGEDIYMHTAKAMRIEDRQIGKVATLALGYQGAVGAFKAMAKAYGLYLPEEEVKKIVKAWRMANPWAVQFWADLETAATRAVKHPKRLFTVGRLKYRFDPDLLGGTLVCSLPNSGQIQYPQTRLEMVETPYGDKLGLTCLKASLTAPPDAKEWPRGSLYGGLLAENATQATAAALLRDTLIECDDVVAHVHDELILEVPTGEAEMRANELREIMETRPIWADGLPLLAEPQTLTRYGK